MRYAGSVDPPQLSQEQRRGDDYGGLVISLLPNGRSTSMMSRNPHCCGWKKKNPSYAILGKKKKSFSTLSSPCRFSYVIHQIFFNLCRRLMDFRVSQSLTEIVYKTQINSVVISWLSHDFSLLRDKARLSFLSLHSLTLNSQRCDRVATWFSNLYYPVQSAA